MRKSPAKKRRLLPDAKFNDTMVTQFVNNMMYDGKNYYKNYCNVKHGNAKQKGRWRRSQTHESYWPSAGTHRLGRACLLHV